MRFIESGLLFLCLSLLWVPTGTAAEHRWENPRGILEFDGPVFDLRVYEGELVATGRFRTAGGVAVNNIAAFDGEIWRPLGEGVGSGAVDDASWGGVLFEYNGALIAGGRFDYAGSAEAHNIASYEDGVWTNLGTGVSGRVNGLGIDGGKLVVGGLFEFAGGIRVNRVATWRDRWNSLGSGLDAGVMGLIIEDSKLFVGGIFSQAGGRDAPRLARWEDQAWFSDGDGFDSSGSEPAALMVIKSYEGSLYAGGLFARSGLHKAVNVARRENGEWVGVDIGVGVSGTLDWVVDFETFGEDLIAVGKFARAGSVRASNVARLVDGEWQAMGAGVNEDAKCAAVYQGQLYVGGAFTLADGARARGVARWSEKLGVPSVPTPRFQLAVAPNPFNPASTISFEIPQDGNVRVRAYDIRGRHIATLLDAFRTAGEDELGWDGRDAQGRSLASGVYFIELISGDERRVTKLSLVR